MNLDLICEGLEFPEGPIAMADGSVILTEIKGQKLTRVKPDGSKEPSRESTMLVRPTSGFFGRLSQVLRPMITGLPMVTARKLARSVFSRQGRPPSLPMTPFLARAMGPAVRVMLGMATPYHHPLVPAKAGPKLNLQHEAKAELRPRPLGPRRSSSSGRRSPDPGAGMSGTGS